MPKGFRFHITPNSAKTFAVLSILSSIILTVELLQLTVFSFEGMKRSILFGGLALIFAFETGIRFKKFSLKQFSTLKEMLTGAIALTAFGLSIAFLVTPQLPIQLSAIAAYIIGVLVVVNVIELFKK